MNVEALALATAAGTVAQVAMVVAGHHRSSVKALFPVGGMGFSLAAGLLYAALSSGDVPEGALGGAVAGGACAFIGIGVSRVMKDVPTSLLALGTLSSVVAGAIGGALGRLLL